MSEESLNLSEKIELQPQIRFLWQVADEVAALQAEATERFGVPFTDGYDGICLFQARKFAAGKWSLSVKDGICRLHFADSAAMVAGVRFAFDQMSLTERGTLELPVDSWSGNARED